MTQLITLFILSLFGGLLQLSLNTISSNTDFCEECLIVKMADGNRILKLTNNKGETEEIYKSDKYRAHSLTVSPDNQYIAFIEETKYKCTRNGLYEVAPRRDLVIIDGSGNEVNRIVDRDIKKYAWSPSSDKVTFVSFKSCDCDYKYKCPTGAWIFDLDSSQTIKIADTAKNVYWALHDSAIYLFCYWDIKRYDPQSKRLEITDYKDIYFSPDGKYYIVLYKREDRPVQLYATETNEKLFDIVVYENNLPPGVTAERFPKDIGALWGSGETQPPYGWLFNQGHYMMFLTIDAEIETAGSGPIKRIISRKILGETNYIYDPERREVIKEFNGKIDLWIGNGDQVIVERDGQIIIEEIK